MPAMREDQSVFGHLSAERLFESVTQHEIAHASFDATPCPFQHCLATSEYFAYTQQIHGLSAEERAPIVDRLDPDNPVRRDMINPMILLMAPDRFAASAWGHFKARGNACLYWQGLVSGAIIFDHMHP